MFFFSAIQKLGLNKRNHENTAQNTVHRREVKRLSKICFCACVSLNVTRDTAYMTITMYVQYNQDTVTELARL